MTAFADRLRALREARLLTQEGLAERAGLTVKAVGALERGERLRPYPHTVRSLADALGLDGDERAALVASVPSRSGSVARQDRPDPEPGPGTPGRLGPVVGREDDLEAVLAAVRTPSRPVVTLTGPGGVGKTTLALAAARQGGVRLPGWGGRGRPGGHRHPGCGPGRGRHRAGRARGRVRGRGRRPRALRRRAAPAARARQRGAGARLRAGRRRTGPALPGPRRAGDQPGTAEDPRGAGDPAGAAGGAGGRALFLERLGAAGVVLDDGPEIAELCRRLDGLPLALELAASAAATLGPSNLLDHLDTALGDGPRDLPERQRSMRATLAWSLDLVDPADRALLERLSVVPGSFSLATADAVGGGAALLPLRRLVEHSLVARSGEIRGTARFRLLEPVRQHVAELLPAAEREVALTAVTERVRELARGLTDDVKGVDAAAALDLLDADFGQVRVAFLRLVDEARHDAAAELAWRLWLFLAHRGHGREGLAWFGLLDGRPMGDEARVRLNIARSGLDFLVGDIAGQRVRGEEALTLARRLGRADLAAEAGLLAASAALFAGDLQPARVMLDAAREHAVQAELGWLEAHALIAMGQVALLAGEPDAEEALLAGVTAAREVGNPFTLAMALNVLATLTALRGEHARTASLLAESVTLSIEARMSWTLAYTLPALAGVAVQLGRPSAGAQLFGASASYSAQHSVAANFQASRDLAHAELAAAREALGEVDFKAAWDAGREASGAGVIDLARDLIRDGPG